MIALGMHGRDSLGNQKIGDGEEKQAQGFWRKGEREQASRIK